MITPVSRERWNEAQLHEIDFRYSDYDEAVRLRGIAYQAGFHFLNIDKDQHGKHIIEVGSADVPVIYFCGSVQGTIVEPLTYPILERVVNERGYQWIRTPFEDTDLQGDEVWLLNVLQHVIDPERFIQVAKRTAPVVRFFEPIDYGTCVYHPHAFNLADFQRWFGDCVKYYDGTPAWPNFHDGPCAYGVWSKGGSY